MKTTKRILALLLIGLLSISNAFAEGFPEEPMVIYGNVTGSNIENKSLKISDGNNKLLKQVQISNSKYGTNKTFDIDSKISLSPFTGTLKFQIDGYNFTSVSKGETNSCETETVFQKGNICEYNLAFNKIIVSSGGGGYSSSSSSSSNTTTSITSDISNDTTTVVENNATTESINIKRNEDGKIVIKGTDYIQNLRTFNLNNKEIKKVFGYNIINIKGDDAYNKNVVSYAKNIYNNIKLPSIRKNMMKYLDKMSTTYGVYTNPGLDEGMKETYKEKLREDKEYFELKMVKLKRKDEIIRYVLEKRSALN